MGCSPRDVCWLDSFGFLTPLFFFKLGVRCCEFIFLLVFANDTKTFFKSFPN